MFQLLYFQSHFLIIIWEKAAVNGLSIWVPATHVGAFLEFLTPDFGLAPPWGMNQQIEDSLSPFLYASLKVNESKGKK